MFKVMMLQKRNSGFDLQEFIDNYESAYPPVIMKYHTKMTRYMRHFLSPAPYSLDGVVKDAEHDLLSELWFEDRGAYDDGMARMTMARMTTPDANKELGDLEERFLDRSKSRLAFVEEHESHLPRAKQAPDPSSDLRRIILLKRRSDLTIEQFIDYYEHHHAPLAVQNHGPDVIRYRRMFLRAAPNPLYGSILEPAFDVVTEVSRPADEPSKPMVPEVGQLYDDDEENFTYKPARRAMHIETRESVLPWVDKQ